MIGGCVGPGGAVAPGVPGVPGVPELVVGVGVAVALVVAPIGGVVVAPFPVSVAVGEAVKSSVAVAVAVASLPVSVPVAMTVGVGIVVPAAGVVVVPGSGGTLVVPGNGSGVTGMTVTGVRVLTSRGFGCKICSTSRYQRPRLGSSGQPAGPPYQRQIPSNVMVVFGSTMGKTISSKPMALSCRLSFTRPQRMRGPAEFLQSGGPVGK